MLSLWEVLKTSKGLPAPDGFTALFARSLSDTYTLAEISGIPPLNLGEIVEIVDYTIYGNAYQSENVSPDTPQEVVGVGERTGNLAYDKIEAVNIGTGGIIVRTSGYDVAIAHVEIGEVYTVDSYVLAFYTDEPEIGSVSYDGSRVVETMGQPTTFVAPITGYVAFRVNSGEQPMLNSGSTPLPYEPYGYKVDVVSRGKNLFDIRTITENAYLNGGTGLTGDSQYSDTSDFIMVIGEIITISATLSGDLLGTGTRDICFYNSSKVLIRSLTLPSDLSQSVTIAVPKGATYVRFAYDKSCTNIQLEAGSTATSYEPYIPPITTPIYLDSPLYKIGDYADSRGSKEEVRVIKELVLTGEETINYNPTNNTFYFILDKGYYTGSVRSTPLFCSHYTHIEDGRSFSDMPNNSIYIAPLGSATSAYIYSTNYADLAAFKSYLAAQYAAGTPVKVYYVLAEPETKTVEPVEIPTLNGTTVIDVDTEVKPSYMWVEYKSSTSEYNPVALRTADSNTIQTADGENLMTRS